MFAVILGLASGLLRIQRPPKQTFFYLHHLILTGAVRGKMGFLGKILGSKPPQGATVQFSEMDAFVQKHVANQEQELRKTAAGKFSEIKHLLGEIKNSLGELESAEIEEKNQRLARIVTTSRNQMLKQLSALSVKLAPPESNDLDTIRNYCLASAEMLEREIKSFGKNIAYTGILLKEKIKKTGGHIKELNSIFLELKSELTSKNLIFLAPEVEELAELVTDKQSKIKSLEKNITALNSSINSQQEKQTLLNKELQSLETGAEFEALDSIRGKKSALLKQKQELKSNLINLFSSVDKPMKRFEKLVKETRIQMQPEKSAMLSEYIANPFIALKKDPKAEILKQVLSELKSAIAEGKVPMKEKEKEKRISALEELLKFDFFENVFWKLNKAESEFLALEKEEKEQGILSKISKKQAELAEVERQVQEKGSELNSAKDGIEKEEENIAMIKEKLTELLEQISGQQITLIL